MARKLTQEDLERYRSTLLLLRRELAGDIGELESDAFSNDGARPSVDNPADNGSDSFSQEFSLELLQRDEAAFEEIEAALARIEQGGFGRCERCEAWIPKARLNAVPYARNCVDCQRALEEAG
jgi:RNA polymerase-binding transcription factor DksA